MMIRLDRCAVMFALSVRKGRNEPMVRKRDARRPRLAALAEGSARERL